MESPSICDYAFIHCVDAGMSILMSLSDGLGAYFLCHKMEKTRFMGEGRDGKLFISRQSWQFFLYKK